MAKYVPTEAAQNNPRRVYLKKSRKWVGVGGPVQITRKPPKKNQTIREATPEEYKHLFENRKMVNLVQLSGSDANDANGDEANANTADADGDGANANDADPAKTPKAKKAKAGAKANTAGGNSAQ